jgi:single-strand DNA-binding protein
MNKVILIGRTGKDPEIRHLESGKVVATFSLATDKRYKTASGERKTDTSWHNIVIWGKLAEVAEKWLKKGQMLMIEGSISNRSYEDKDKVKRYVTEILCDNFEMLGGKSESDQSDRAQAEKNGADMAKASMQDTGLPPSDIGGPGYNPDDKDNDLPFSWILPLIGIGIGLFPHVSNVIG